MFAAVVESIILDVTERVETMVDGNCKCCPFWDYCNPDKSRCEEAVRSFFDRYMV